MMWKIFSRHLKRNENCCVARNGDEEAWRINLKKIFHLINKLHSNAGSHFEWEIFSNLENTLTSRWSNFAGRNSRVRERISTSRHRGGMLNRDEEKNDECKWRYDLEITQKRRSEDSVSHSSCHLYLIFHSLRNLFHSLTFASAGREKKLFFSKWKITSLLEKRIREGRIKVKSV